MGKPVISKYGLVVRLPDHLRNPEIKPYVGFGLREIVMGNAALNAASVDGPVYETCTNTRLQLTPKGEEYFLQLLPKFSSQRELITLALTIADKTPHFERHKI